MLFSDACIIEFCAVVSASDINTTQRPADALMVTSHVRCHWLPKMIFFLLLHSLNNFCFVVDLLSVYKDGGKHSYFYYNTRFGLSSAYPFPGANERTVFSSLPACFEFCISLLHSMHQIQSKAHPHKRTPLVSHSRVHLEEMSAYGRIILQFWYAAALGPQLSVRLGEVSTHRRYPLAGLRLYVSIYSEKHSSKMYVIGRLYR